jgi:phosphatidate phosphatase PAH1
MSYAVMYINSVEYGPSFTKRDYYAWDKKSRASFSEEKLAAALNKAYAAGRKSAIAEMAEALSTVKVRTRG